MAQQIQFNIDLNTLPVKKCECGHEFVVARLQLRFVSAIQSPNGQAQWLVTQSGFLCAFCGIVVDTEVKEEDTEKKSNLVLV